MTDYEKACAEVETPNYNYDHENDINFEKWAKVATVTTCEVFWINRIKRYAKKYPDLYQICSEKNGTIVAHIPRDDVKISHVERNVTDEQKRAFVERTQASRMKRQNVSE